MKFVFLFKDEYQKAWSDRYKEITPDFVENNFFYWMKKSTSLGFHNAKTDECIIKLRGYLLERYPMERVINHEAMHAVILALTDYDTSCDYDKIWTEGGYLP